MSGHNQSMVNPKPLDKPLLPQPVVLAIVIGGVALTYLLSGREPGWQPFLASLVLAGVYLLAALVPWRINQWLGVLAMAVLMLAILWDEEKPAAIAAGVIITILNVMASPGKSDEVDDMLDPASASQGE